MDLNTAYCGHSRVGVRRGARRRTSFRQRQSRPRRIGWHSPIVRQQYRPRSCASLTNLSVARLRYIGGTSTGFSTATALLTSSGSGCPTAAVASFRAAMMAWFCRLSSHRRQRPSALVVPNLPSVAQSLSMSAVVAASLSAGPSSVQRHRLRLHRGSQWLDRLNLCVRMCTHSFPQCSRCRTCVCLSVCWPAGARFLVSAVARHPRSHLVL